MKKHMLPVFAVVLLTAVPVLLSLNMNSGHFLYTLDDPYIHLTLASSIGQGHYGINSGENTSPSSSILWPFLLVPFSGTGFYHLVPLVLNIVFACATAVLLYGFFGRGNLLLFLVSVVVFNLPGLALTGMEHSLQVLLTVYIAVEVVGYSKKGVHSPLLPVALVVAPAVRYECLAVSVPVLLYLFFSGERRTAIIGSAAVLLMAGGFSLFLVHLGLDPLPASVMAKSSVASGQGFAGNLLNSLTGFRGAVQALIAVPLLLASVKKRRPAGERHLALASLFAVLLHLAVGRFGWFHRYGVYAWAFSVLMLFHLYRPFLEKHKLLFPAVLFLSGANYFTGYLNIPHASSNIYRQQYQMARFSCEMLREPVAVNDLGLVGLYTDDYVLDLWGLAVPEALDGASDPAWVDSAAAASGVNLAMVYYDELPGIQHWKRLARMELHPPLVVCVSGGVDFLGAPWADHNAQYALLEDFAETLPDGIDFILYR